MEYLNTSEIIDLADFAATLSQYQSLVYSTLECSIQHGNKLTCFVINFLWERLRMGWLSSGMGLVRGKYHCTVDLLFDWFGLVCFETKNKNCQ
jgi:hypothetical protein